MEGGFSTSKQINNVKAKTEIRIMKVLIFVAVVLHFLFLSSVFDIYFRSPIIPSERQHAPNYNGAAAAKRLVLFVADGLRAESLFKDPKRAPFLAKAANHMGAWGVSHTKLPTESRPGHVALIAGMFEDPSAITKGWQENPVNFDTVFNQSRYVWSWGSPDILPMFAKGAWNNQVFADTYEPALEKFFANQEISNLDTWVFDKVKAFFSNEKENGVLRRSDQLVLFLHLLGLDTNGHSNKPHSPEFAKNLKIVDEGVQEITRICEEFWRHDGRTSYIFTADHGMTDWGSHGAGMDHETQTPFIAWGAGIRSPEVGKSSWPSFSEHKSNDINQTDVAPLMSALIGVNMPQHSVGQLPLDYLNLHPSDKIEAKLANSLQIYEQYQSMKARRTKTWFKIALLPRPDPFQLNLEEVLQGIKALKGKTKYDAALNKVDELYQQSLQALFHYQRYHRLPLYIATSFSYVGFITYTILLLLKEFTSLLVFDENNGAQKFLAFGTIYALAVTLGQNVPLYYFFYYCSPFYIWSKVLGMVWNLHLAPNQGKQCLDLLKTIGLSFLVIEGLIMAFFDRRAISIAIFVLMVLHLRSNPSRIAKLCWTVLCILLMAFSFQPSVGKEREPMMVLGSSLLLTICGVFYKINQHFKSWTSSFLLLLTLLSGLCTAFSTIDESGLVQLASWTIFISAFPLALLSGNGLVERLFNLSLAIMSIYNLFSLTYEALFMTCLTFAMHCWLKLEHAKGFTFVKLEEIRVMQDARQRNVINSDDFLRALTFLTFTIVSFFGTGNIASLNSFDPRSIQTLVTTFSPFLMGGLLLFKVILPFFGVALFAFSVQYVTQMPFKALFLIVLVFSDVMGLHFFFMVTDQGSWLDIGTSLSHFVIVEGTVIFMQLLFLLANFFMKINLGRISDNDLRIVIKPK